MPIFPEATLKRLLASMEAGRLIIVCGAGLSMPAPSNLMSAIRVAQCCYDKYAPTEVLPANFRDDLNLLAGHFFDQGQFKTLFISRLVPWDELVGEPNSGHAAIADFLISRSVFATLSANFDPLIEEWAHRHKVAMRGALTGTDAAMPSDAANPLLKFHGCFSQLLAETVWTVQQLNDPVVANRIANCVQWMNLNLPEKDLLIVGFWTDWDYLNDVLDNVAAGQGVNSVTVVDRLDSAALEAKAPGLWTALATGHPFEHVQASSGDALEELRLEFSKVWVRKFLGLAKPLVEADGHAYPQAIESIAWTSDDAYQLRRDSEGVPYTRAARKKEPGLDASLAAYAHLLLVRANATRKGAWYDHDGTSIRIVQGAGRAINAVRESFAEPPAGEHADIVICAGADDLNVPAAIIPSGTGSSIVRPAPGGGARWLTLPQAREELHI